MRRIEEQQRAKRGLSVAVASRDVDMLRSVAAASQQGGALAKREGRRAESELRAMERARLLHELREATTQEADAERLREAARAAAEGGLDGPELERAWERLRRLGTCEWLSQQLQAATTRGDIVKLAAVVSQAEAFECHSDADAPLRGEAARLFGDLLSVAKERLAAGRAEEHEQQELQLARASGDPTSLLAALRAARREPDVTATSSDDDSAASTPPLPAPPPAVFSPRVGRSRPRATDEEDLPVLLGRLPPPPCEDIKKGVRTPPALKDGKATGRSRRQVHWADALE
mmetsp:Transcript_92192/g.256604  ORF Transcript_92192/g.256604 Transcript_92192/m.256604 type:complete len:289 (+) Transcript_92192:1-867(+)